MKLPTFFISHGGGPWPYIPEMKAQFAKTAEWLSNFSNMLGERPKAILSISGHWETSEFTVSSAEKPPMIYDYGGFPAYTYKVQYPAPGSPKVAARVQALLTQVGIKNNENPTRGFDHGTFVPLCLMYPKADIPVVSMSIKSNYDVSEHIKMGEALTPLRDEGVLIIGSGLSYHNMSGFGRPSSLAVSKEFGKWLEETISDPDINKRNQKLINWEKAPGARSAHPQEDHLIPLMVVAGAAEEKPGKVAFVDHVMGVEMASYKFE
jgi:aromatic ring-opening dioxygenase catalytic subunit (LigB family)